MNKLRKNIVIFYELKRLGEIIYNCYAQKTTCAALGEKYQTLDAFFTNKIKDLVKREQEIFSYLKLTKEEALKFAIDLLDYDISCENKDLTTKYNIQKTNKIVNERIANLFEQKYGISKNDPYIHVELDLEAKETTEYLSKQKIARKAEKDIELEILSVLLINLEAAIYDEEFDTCRAELIALKHKIIYSISYFENYALDNNFKISNNIFFDSRNLDNKISEKLYKFLKSIILTENFNDQLIEFELKNDPFDQTYIGDYWEVVLISIALKSFTQCYSGEDKQYAYEELEELLITDEDLFDDEEETEIPGDIHEDNYADEDSEYEEDDMEEGTLAFLSDYIDEDPYDLVPELRKLIEKILHDEPNQRKRND
jgi:hypothetical protein